MLRKMNCPRKFKSSSFYPYIISSIIMPDFSLYNQEQEEYNCERSVVCKMLLEHHSPYCTKFDQTHKKKSIQDFHCPQY